MSSPYFEAILSRLSRDDLERANLDFVLRGDAFVALTSDGGVRRLDPDDVGERICALTNDRGNLVCSKPKAEA